MPEIPARRTPGPRKAHRRAAHGIVEGREINEGSRLPETIGTARRARLTTRDGMSP